jgi:hypothetical protein
MTNLVADVQIISKQAIARERPKFVSRYKKAAVDVNRSPKEKKWCRERLNWSSATMKTGDESNFKIVNRKSKTFVRRKNTEKYLQQHSQSRIQKGGDSLRMGMHIGFRRHEINDYSNKTIHHVIQLIQSQKQ